MKLGFGIGNDTQYVEIEDSSVIDVLYPNDIPKSDDEYKQVEVALSNPIGTKPLEEIVCAGEKVAIITSDITRPMPTAKVLPAVLKRLYKAGVKKEDISLIFALGSHRGHSKDEMIKLAGEQVFNEISCIDSDPNCTTLVGTTKKGTPVEIFTPVLNAERRICLGNIEYHYFAGYSGGAKAIMPGVSTKRAIRINHSQMTNPNACAGKLAGNPVREDIEEAAAMVGVDFILNVVLDEHKNIAYAVAGDVTQAHRKGCAYLDELYSKKITKKADIVIVSQGGAPKDINLYQTQKALDNSKYAVKDGGIIILVGACDEGLGQKTFEQWIEEANCPDDLITRIQQDFQLGGHKAAAIAMVQQKANVFLVSHLPKSLVEKMHMTPFETVECAYKAAQNKLGTHAEVIAMPYGGSTLPIE